LFPEIVTPLLDSTDDLPSCSAVEALERQEPFINQTLAYQALAMLARLFRHGEITHHGGFVSLANGRMAPNHTTRSIFWVSQARSMMGLSGGWDTHQTFHYAKTMKAVY